MHVRSKREKTESVLDRDGSSEETLETSYTPAALRAHSEGGKVSCAQQVKWIEHNCPHMWFSQLWEADAQELIQRETRAYTQDAKAIAPNTPRCAMSDTFQRRKKPLCYTLL